MALSKNSYKIQTFCINGAYIIKYAQSVQVPTVADRTAKSAVDATFWMQKICMELFSQ